MAKRSQKKAGRSVAQESKECSDKGGRPSLYRPEFPARAEALCLLGLTDKQLAECFGINPDTLYSWKDKHPEFRQAIERGKEQADQKVAASLFQRACGYEHPHTELFCYEGVVIEHQITKRYPPEVAACIFWLKNRRPDLWRDKLVELNVENNVYKLPEAFMAKVRQKAQARFEKTRK